MTPGATEFLLGIIGTELDQTLHTKFVHLDQPNHVCRTPLGLIEANVFTVNKPSGMEFNWDEVQSIHWCPRRRGEDQSW